MDPYSRVREKDINLQKWDAFKDLWACPTILILCYNTEVGNSARHAIGPYEDLLTLMRKRKLKLYGHIARSTELAKVILQGTVQGRQTEKETGRQHDRMDTFKVGQRFSKRWKLRRMEKWLPNQALWPNGHLDLWISEVKWHPYHKKCSMGKKKVKSSTEK